MRNGVSTRKCTLTEIKENKRPKDRRTFQVICNSDDLGFHGDRYAHVLEICVSVPYQQLSPFVDILRDFVEHIKTFLHQNEVLFPVMPCAVHILHPVVRIVGAVDVVNELTILKNLKANAALLDLNIWNWI